MKKITAWLLTMGIILCVGIFPVFAQEEESPDLQDYKNYLWTLSDDMNEEEFLTSASKDFKFIQSIEPIVEEDSYQTLFKANTHLKQKADGAKQEFMDALDHLRMKTSVADGVIFLWDRDNIPYGEEELPSPEELDKTALDYAEFIPLVVKCLQEDPSQARGNIIVISGGAGSNRSNYDEAYPAKDVFFDMGYNVFVLQYRVSPFVTQDMFMDTQRAIRYVRYQAEQEGWGGQDLIAAAGFGAGVMGTVNNLYGDINPVKYDPDYIPDEIDAVNSDLDVVLGIYAAFFEEHDNTEHLPAFYLCVGTEDTLVKVPGQIALYEFALDHGVSALLHVIEGAGHGFGVGQEGANNATPECTLWPEEADAFLQANRGHVEGKEPTAQFESTIPEQVDAEEQEDSASGESEVGESADAAANGESDAESAGESSPAPLAEIPEGYEKVKTFTGTYGFGDAEITAATNEEEDRFFFTFSVFGDTQALEGTVSEGVVHVDYDMTGFMANEAQMIWDNAMASSAPWEPVSR